MGIGESKPFDLPASLTDALRLLLVLALLLMPALAQDRRQQAFELCEQNRFVEALPLLEELAAQNPSDGQVQLKLGFCRLVQANTLTDKALRKARRARAREALVEADRLGVRDSLLTAALESLAADGGEEPVFSTSSKADEAMQRAETAFAARRYAEARAAYQEAFQADPTLYEAALSIGQTYRLENAFSQADEWYARAVAIAPEREAAYRYWGNSLMASGKSELALPKYIEAYLCEPYARLSRNGLISWAKQQGVVLAHPRVDIPVEVKAGKLHVAPSAGPAWLAYAFERSDWQSGKWARYHPGQPYRHSLEEEASAIRVALNTASEGNITPDKALMTLHKLNQAGLLEAFILLGMAREGIVEDYPAYRKEHRAELERYVREVVLKGGG